MYYKVEGDVTGICQVCLKEKDGYIYKNNFYCNTHASIYMKLRYVKQELEKAKTTIDMYRDLYKKEVRKNKELKQLTNLQKELIIIKQQRKAKNV